MNTLQRLRITKRLPYAVSLTTLALCSASAQADIIFSEYIEGSGNNKAIELTNTGLNTVDLSDYLIELYSNGNTTTTNTLNLTGSLDPNKSYVIAHPSATTDIQNVANLTSSVSFFNGNDVLLLKNDNQVIDRIGQLGSSENFAKDVTLVRKSSVITGDTNINDAFKISEEWDVYDQDTFTYLGNPGNGNQEPPTQYACGDPVTFISSIQGSGAQSPIVGESVVIEAVVIGNFQESDRLGGFFVQEENSDTDNDPTTSEGLFVFHSETPVNVGDRVLVAGVVDEFFNLTQLNQVNQVEICDTEVSLPAYTELSLPFNTASEPEHTEGMRVAFPSTLTVNEVYNLSRYGEFTVANGRKYIPTEIATPGAEANQIDIQNDLNLLIVDDGFKAQNPDNVVYPSPGLSAHNTLRAGNQVTNLSGIINYSFGDYKLLPTSTPNFENTNERPQAPESPLESQLRIASFNVLNYFNGDGLGDGFPTERGADTPSELTRQETKLVSALDTINADIVGLMELENDGFNEFSAISTLVNALNELQAEGQEYLYIKPSVERIGDDAIAVGMIYRPSKVALLNNAAILSSANSPLDEQNKPLFRDNLNRPALTQSFTDLASGEVFTLVVNHLKSKGPRNCADHEDCDQNDGQGAYNQTRTQAAKALTLWLASNPTNVDTENRIILGDLNAYAKEDPITTIIEAGYTSLKENGSYTYLFSGESGTLDHALASASMAEHVLSTQSWHINADEPRALDYNEEHKSPSQIESFYSPTPFRSSDHDPVIIDLAFDRNQAPEAEIKAHRFWFWWLLTSNSYDPDGYIEQQSWTIGNKTIAQPWAFVSNHYLKRNNIQEISLTVTDNEGANSTTRHKFK